MRTNPVLVIVASVLMLGLVVGICAQVKKDTKTGLDRLEGTIRDIDKAKSILTITQTGATEVSWKVAYNDETKFTSRNAPAKLDDLKSGLRVIVLGKYENETMMANRIDLRTEK